MDNQRLRIGFVSTRLSGTDGVSLETNKWVDILQGLRHECFCFCILPPSRYNGSL
ncbi:MAG: hypothetical protein SRB2_01091 [Desulfobacteraceae bacterium Eth-SRB2]|nr:MAG: hypothetical protein SRB2_01091 [Desulfobacteraceae bacterium Eth-SRB2]